MVFGIDFNPNAIKQRQREGHQVAYGDTTDSEFVTGLHLAGVKQAVSAVPQQETGVTRDDPRMVLIEALRDAAGQAAQLVLGNEGPPPLAASKLD